MSSLDVNLSEFLKVIWQTLDFWGYQSMKILWS